MFARNRIELTGNIAKPSKTTTVGETTVTRARLIHSESLDRAGSETRERLTAVEIEVLGIAGEAFAQHVTTKKPIYIEGSLQLAEWEKEGRRLFRHFIRVSNWQFLLPKEPEATA